MRSLFYISRFVPLAVTRQNICVANYKEACNVSGEIATYIVCTAFRYARRTRVSIVFPTSSLIAPRLRSYLLPPQPRIQVHTPLQQIANPLNLRLLHLLTRATNLIHHPPLLLPPLRAFNVMVALLTSGESEITPTLEIYPVLIKLVDLFNRSIIISEGRAVVGVDGGGGVFAGVGFTAVRFLRFLNNSETLVADEALKRWGGGDYEDPSYAEATSCVSMKSRIVFNSQFNNRLIFSFSPPRT